jgi:light-regulated signal transduction histidine kinase (bacteriophytochrome)
MLAEEASPVLNDSGKHHLDTIRDSVEHMSQLLEDLLKLSRLGRQELSKQVCSLKPLVEEVVKGLKPEMQDRQVEWRIADLPFVEGDPVLLKQVFVNLLSNALKFTRTRQPAIIEIGQTTIDGEPVVFVRDNGVGFSMKYADKLFGLFQRLHRQQDFEGTGVGLAIVQRIIHRHGGRVWAEAEVNKGATFYLSLRACEAEKKELATATAAV